MRVCARVWCEVRVMGRVEESGGVLISCPGEIVVRKEVAFIMLYKICQQWLILVTVHSTKIRE